MSELVITDQFGHEHIFPEGTSLDAAKKVVMGAQAQSSQGSAWDALKEFGSKVADVGLGMGSGAYKGLVNATAGAPGNFAALGDALSQKISGHPMRLAENLPLIGPSLTAARLLSGEENKLPSMPTGEQLIAKGPTPYEPDTKAGKYAEEMTQGAATMLGPGKIGAKALIPTEMPFALTGKGAALGAASGAGGQAASDYTHDAPLSRLMGQLAPLLFGLLGLKTPNSIATVRDMVKEIGPEKLAKIEDNQISTTNALGIPSDSQTLLTHGMANTPQAAPFVALVKAIASSSQGGPIRAQLATEMDALRQGQQDVMGMSGGEARQGPSILAAGKAATYTTPKEILRSTTNPVYEASKSDEFVSRDQGKGLLAALKYAQSKETTGAPSDAIQKAIDSTKKILDSPNWPNGAPAAQYGNIANQASIGVAKGSGQMAGDTAAMAKVGHQQAKDIIDNFLQSTFPTYKAADRLTQLTHENLITPTETGVMGQSFPASTVDKGIPNYAQMQKVLTNPTQFGPDHVSELASRLTQEDSSAFPNLLHQFLVDATADFKSPGSWSRSVAGDVNALPGTADSLQGQNLAQALEEAHLAQGAAPDAAAAAGQGGLNTLHALQTVENGQGLLAGPQDVSEAARAAGTSTLSSLLKMMTPSMEGIRHVSFANVMDRIVRGKTYSDLAEALIAPNGVQKLQDIANYSPSSNAMDIFARGPLSVTAQQGAEGNLP